MSALEIIAARRASWYVLCHTDLITVVNDVRRQSLTETRGHTTGPVQAELFRSYRWDLGSFLWSARPGK